MRNLDAADRYRQLLVAGGRWQNLRRRHAGRSGRGRGRCRLGSHRFRCEEPLQIERGIGIDDDARVELVERDSAERDLQRLRLHVDGGERECLPAQQLLRGGAIERAEIADRNVAGIGCTRRSVAHGAVSQATLRADGAAGHDDVRLRLEIRSERHQVDTARVDSPIDADRIGREPAVELHLACGPDTRSEVDDSLCGVGVAVIVDRDTRVREPELHRGLHRAILEVRRNVFELELTHQERPSGLRRRSGRRGRCCRRTGGRARAHETREVDGAVLLPHRAETQDAVIRRDRW